MTMHKNDRAMQLFFVVEGKWSCSEEFKYHENLQQKQRHFSGLKQKENQYTQTAK
jgi:hypothetical protein